MRMGDPPKGTSVNAQKRFLEQKKRRHSSNSILFFCLVQGTLISMVFCQVKLVRVGWRIGWVTESQARSSGVRVGMGDPPKGTLADAQKRFLGQKKRRHSSNSILKVILFFPRPRDTFLKRILISSSTGRLCDFIKRFFAHFCLHFAY